MVLVKNENNRLNDCLKGRENKQTNKKTILSNYNTMLELIFSNFQVIRFIVTGTCLLSWAEWIQKGP